MASKNSLKISHIFCCNFCDYNTCKKNDYKKHLATDKHEKAKNASKMLENASEKIVNSSFILFVLDYIDIPPIECSCSFFNSSLFIISCRRGIDFLYTAISA